MKEIPFTNSEDHAVHIGNKMVPAHETRMVDPSMLPDAHESNTDENTAAPSNPLLEILDGNVAEVAEALPGLSDAELDMVEQAEADGNTRKGVEKAITEERLRRAAADDPDGSKGDGNTATTGDGGSADV